LKESDLQKLLPRMGYNYKSKVVEIPAWRTDILHPIDITEDIAIAHGYDKFIPSIPKISTTGSESIESRISNKIKEILIGLGITEISSYHLIKEQEAKLLKLKELLLLKDSKTEYKILRPNLLTPALRILSENKDNEYPQQIFELGTIFERTKKQTETGISESQSLLISQSPGNFTDLKKVLDYLMTSIGIPYKIKESTHSSLIHGRTGAIIVNEKVIGDMGEIHPQILSDFKIKMPVSIIEISLEEIFSSCQEA